MSIPSNVPCVITVLHLITALNTGGAETMLYQLVSRSDRTRFRHVVVSMMDRGTLGARIEALGIPLHTLEMRRGALSVWALLQFVAILRRVQPDLLQTWLYHADLLGLVGGMIGRVPVIWNIRSTYHQGLHSIVTRLCAVLSRFTAAVIANSESGRDVHGQFGYRPGRWRIIPNGFDTARFTPDADARLAVRAELGLPADATLIGLVANYHPLKDHRTFLGAAALLREHDARPHFVLVGRGVAESNDVLRRAIDAGGLRGAISLLEERRDVPRLVAALDIASLTSTSEGFPNVVGEAMACGVPCAVTDAGAAAHIVGDAGRVVAPRNPAALAAAWADLLSLSPECRERLRERARARIQSLFALDRIVGQYEALYTEIAQRRFR